MADRWFIYFLRVSIVQRRGRFLISAAAVMLAVGVVSTLAMLSLGIREKIGAELKQYGANMVVTARNGREIPADVAAKVRSLGSTVLDSTVQVYGVARFGSAAVEVMGVEPGRMRGFRLFGSLPENEDELMAGTLLKDVLQAREGGTVRSGDRVYRVTALFEKGPDDDATVVMTVDAARALLGVQGVSAVLLNADTQRLAEIEEQVRSAHPELAARTLRQVAVAEERILARVQLLMLLVTGVVLFSSVIALSSTMNANVIERMKEIGLMKSLGATRGDIRGFFVAEAALAGLCGALAGYTAGAAAAEAVSRTAFGSFIPLNLAVMPGSVLLGVAIAVLATAVPVRSAARVVPAQILRGE